MIDARGAVPESWACIDCGINTAPGCSTREQIEQALVIIRRDRDSVTQTFDEFSEVYTVKPAIWKAAGMEPWGGCLCIGRIRDNQVVMVICHSVRPLYLITVAERRRSDRAASGFAVEPACSLLLV
jgi:hypothetical protein